MKELIIQRMLRGSGAREKKESTAMSCCGERESGQLVLDEVVNGEKIELSWAAAERKVVFGLEIITGSGGEWRSGTCCQCRRLRTEESEDS